LHFVGNIEGRDLFNDKADVVVCDGYTGNILLENGRVHLRHDGREKDARPVSSTSSTTRPWVAQPILGINDNAIIGHGREHALSHLQHAGARL
jgi:glycerol-3-phosphate acyltransferase PlsX